MLENKNSEWLSPKEKEEVKEWKKENLAEPEPQEEKGEEKEETNKKIDISKIAPYYCMVEEFLKKQPVFYDETKTFWKWDYSESKWKETDEVELLNLIKPLLGSPELMVGKARQKIIYSFQQLGRENKPKNPPLEWIQLKDCVFDIKEKDIVKDIKKSEYFFFNPIPWRIGDPDSTPTFDKLFTEWVGSDYKETLYEWLAYSLYRSCPIHIIPCLFGIGSNGKCGKGSDLVLMANGSWKKLEDMRIGDYVVSPQKDGGYIHSKIKNVHSRFEKEVYDVYETSRKKRKLYTIAGNHIIPLIRTYTQRTSKDDSTPRFRERRLFEYEARKIAKLKNSKSFYCGFTTTAVDFKRENNLEPDINPYCLGAWIGDGCYSLKINKKRSLSHFISITSMDREIIEEFKKSYPLEMRGMYTKVNNKASSYCITHNGKFGKLLRSYNLKSGNKYIPEECLTASINYRLELLAGLLDTDGFIDKQGAISFCSKEFKIAQNIKALVFSLGGYAEIRSITKRCQNEFSGNYYDVSIQFKNKTQIPFRVPFKKSRLKNINSEPRLVAIECRPTKPCQVYGIELEEGDSKWYVTNDWFVTHNSQFLEVIEKVLGEDNVASTSLKDITSNRFESSSFHKKLVCTISETDSGVLEETTTLKQLSAGDRTRFESKGKKVFYDKTYTKLIISTNAMKESYANVEGWWRRWLVIEFPNKFPNGKPIINCIPEQEFENLLAKLLRILPKLLEEGKFTNQGTVQDQERKYKSISNPLELFIEDNCVRNEFAFVKYSELFIAYIQFLKKKGMQTISRKAFSMALDQLGYEVDKTTKRLDDVSINGHWVLGVCFPFVSKQPITDIH